MSVLTSNANLAPRVDQFVQALKGYDGTGVHLKPLLQAVHGLGTDLNSEDIRRFALQLGKIDGLKSSRGAGISRFGEAPKRIYPGREEVVGNVLAIMGSSPNPSVRALARELGFRVFKEIAGDVEIYGRNK